MKYKILAHTADIRTRVYGKTIEELFKNSAACLFNLITAHKPGKNIKKEITLQSNDRESLLVLWLNELISSFYAEKFLPRLYKIKITKSSGKNILKATVKGGNFDPYDNNVKREIKAATYYGVKTRRINGEYRAEVIFDV